MKLNRNQRTKKKHFSEHTSFIQLTEAQRRHLMILTKHKIYARIRYLRDRLT